MQVARPITNEPSQIKIPAEAGIFSSRRAMPARRITADYFAAGSLNLAPDALAM